MLARSLFLSACLLVVLRAQDGAGLQPLAPVNERLPQWIRLGGEYRARFEDVSGIGFAERAADGYLLNRVRLNLELRPLPQVRFFFQAQDARIFWNERIPSAPPYEDSLDLRQAFVEAGDIEKSPLALRLGRQEINFGEQRLIGSSNWTNTSRTFDAVRLVARGSLGRVRVRADAFAAAVVNVRDHEMNHHQQGNNLHGVWAGIEHAVPKSVIEPFLLWRTAPWFASPIPETGGRGRLNSKTVGFRWSGTLPGHLDYATELVRQFGNLGGDRIRTWAGHWRVGYRFENVVATPRLVAEANFATGDHDPRDGVRGTFDTLYPTSHDKYGLADQVGWRNIRHLRFGGELKPHRNWTWSTFLQDWWLDSRRDGLYNTSGTVITRIAAGAASTHVGEEIDTQVFYSANKNLQFGGGFAHIFPATFLKEATAGHGYNFTFLTTGYSF